MSIKQNFIKFLFFSGIFLSPFVFWPWNPIPFELPRVWFILRWVEILGLFGSVYLFTMSQYNKLDRLIVTVLFSFSLIAFLTAIFGSDWNKSVWGNPYRNDGLFTFFHLLGLSLFVGWFWQNSWILAFTKAITFSSGLISLWAVTDWIRLTVFNDITLSGWQGAVGATFGQPNFLAGYLSVTLPFTWYFVRNSKLKYNYGFLFIQLAAILVTRSWGGILTSIIFFLLLCFFPSRKKGLHRSSNRLFQLITILICTLFVFIVYVCTHPTNNFIAESRERIFVKLTLAIWKHPLFGWGWANADHAFNSISWPIFLKHDVYLDKAHSLIFESFVTTGIIGGVIYLFVLFSVGKKLYRNQISLSSELFWRKTIILSFILFLFHSQTNVISIGEELIFWILTGMAMISKNKDK